MPWGEEESEGEAAVLSPAVGHEAGLHAGERIEGEGCRCQSMTWCECRGIYSYFDIPLFA